MMNANILIPFIMAAVMAAVLIAAFNFPYLQAKLSVIFAGGVVFILALVQLVRELGPRKKQTPEPEADRKAPGREESGRTYLLEAAWFMGFGLTIYLLGFLIAIPLYTCAYMKSHGTRWPPSIMTGVFMAAFCYIIFVLVLEMKLYPGIILMRWGL
ncbi:MAG: tripartite tricarboxylate transporter TctB family protein [Deltaproteobacteria bacterium]|nr:tripartite tricarboxylate transporter TctB family protein [Deltaproteobacteria bacterium]